MKKFRRGITVVELLVVILMIALLVAILLPAREVAREAGRRTACKNNMKQLGNAILMYDEQHGTLPKSHYLPAGATDEEVPFDLNSRGWSWTYQITPFMERNDLYKAVDPNDPANNPDQDNIDVLGVAGNQIPVLTCPSYSGGRWVEHQAADRRPKALGEDDPRRCFLSNYKPVAASTMDSLAVAYGGPVPTGYGTVHPDGAIHPETDYPVDAIADGMSNTILLAESAEQANSRWIYGNEMEMIGLPETAAPKYHYGSTVTYAYPDGFNPDDPRWYEETEIDEGENGSGLPFVSWNYMELSYEGHQTNNPHAQYGPSSDHPATVNHLFGDASVWSVSKNIDAAAYNFLITREAGDMAPPR